MDNFPLSVIQTVDPEGIVGSHLGLKALFLLKQEAELPLQAFVFPTLIHCQTTDWL